MQLFLDVLSWAFILGGSFFAVVGGIGLLRLPDFYSRIHAAGMTDTLGVWFILIGLMLQAGARQVTIKLVLVLIFLLMTCPLASHALAKAAWLGGLKPWTREEDGGDRAP